ncbi:MAG: hypothetical protein ACREP9_13960 [Candidatus Dormibacteraceae bacterium]
MVAREYLETAEWRAGHDGQDVEAPTAVAGNCVFAGIAASDCICCLMLGRRARGQDHKEATKLLLAIPNQGKEMAQWLTDLLEMKDQATYGFTRTKGSDALKALRRARALVRAAETLLQRQNSDRL